MDHWQLKGLAQWHECWFYSQKSLAWHEYHEVKPLERHLEEPLSVSLRESGYDVSSHQSEVNVSPVAAAPHNQVFVMFCYIYIRNGGLIKAVVLIQWNPNLSCGAWPLLSSPLLLSLSCSRYNLKPSWWSSFCRNWNCEFGMSSVLAVMLRFLLQTRLSILVYTVLNRQLFFFGATSLFTCMTP